jgi:hypothetical protein
MENNKDLIIFYLVMLYLRSFQIKLFSRDYQRINFILLLFFCANY